MLIIKWDSLLINFWLDSNEKQILKFCHPARSWFKLTDAFKMAHLNISSAEGILYVCIIILCSVFIIGGNTLTILAILKKPQLATPSNQFIIGLALADLLVSAHCGLSNNINWFQVYFAFFTSIYIQGARHVGTSIVLIFVIEMFIDLFTTILLGWFLHRVLHSDVFYGHWYGWKPVELLC